MTQTLMKIAIASWVAGCVALFILQFSPSKYTLTEAGRVIVNNNLRPALWGMPMHMLSIYGKTLRILFYGLSSVGFLAAIIGTIYS